MALPPPNDPDRFDSLAATWDDGGSQFICWWHETITGECKVEWDFGSGTKTKELRTYDLAQRFFNHLINQVN